jgi:hypothetical protein
MDAFDKAIERELNKIEEKDIKTFETIHSDNKMVVNKLFNKFKDYEKNTKEKKNEIIESLKERKYEWVPDVSEIKKRDTVYLLDGRNFCELKLVYMGKFFKYCPIRNIMFFSQYYEKHVKPSKNMIFFRKLKKNEKFRIMLIESIAQLD